MTDGLTEFMLTSITVCGAGEAQGRHRQRERL